MNPKLILFLRRLYHYGMYAAGGAVIVVSLVALALKFWFMPNITQYQGDLERVASRAVGHPVAIGALTADWQGLNPRLVLHQVRVTPGSGAPLILPRVEAVASWLSLPLMDLRLAALNLGQASVEIRRGRDGVITLAGIPLNVAGQPSPFPDWLLKQPRIVVKEAQVRWLDEKLGAPEIRFMRIRLLLENRFGRHRFSGIAEPSDAARRVELRGDLKGRSVHDWKSWSGQVYARVDDTRFETWGRWVPWAQEAVKSGVGAVRFWLTLSQGEILGLTGDARLARVAIKLQPGLPDMAFASLSGRIGWSRNQAIHSFFVERLRFQTPGRAPSEPASAHVSLTPDGKGGFQRIDARVSNLRMEALTALTTALPLPRKGHDLIEAFNPRGLVENAQGHWAGPQDYGFTLNLRGAGAKAYGPYPGLSGLSLQVRADQDGGAAQLQGRELGLSWARIFREDLHFAELEGEAKWQILKQAPQPRVRLDFEVARISNADLDGSAGGWIELPHPDAARHFAPRLDIHAHLTRARAEGVHHYLPWEVNDDAYDWLKRSLVAGHSDDVRLVLKGAMDRFPFDQGGGEFKVSVPIRDGVLQFASSWPRIDAIQGLLVFQDKRMVIDAQAGRILEARLGPVHGVIPDIHTAGDKDLILDGRAAGETRAFLDFIRHSPVNDYTGRFTEAFKAGGNGNLALSLRVPLHHASDTAVSGNFAFQGNRIEPGGGVPPLDQVTGILAFTDKGLQAKAIGLNILGQPARLDLVSQPGGQVRGQLAGRVGAAALKPYLPAGLAGRLSGMADWRAEVGMNASMKTELTVSSDLVGMALDLPAPFGKAAAQPMALKVGKLPGEGGQENVSLRYGELLSLRAQLPQKGEARVNVRIGQGEAAPPGEPGLWISGRFQFLDLDVWRGLAPGEGAGALPLREASLSFNEVRLFNRRLHDTHLQLRPSGGSGWQVALAGKELDGEVVTVPEGKATRVLARFKRLSIPEAEPGGAASPASFAGLAALEVSANALQWKGRDLGELRLRLSPAKNGLNVDNFSLATPEGKIGGKGVLADHPRRPTRLELNLESGKIGLLLARLGYPGAIKGGETRLSGTLGWLGGLEDFNLHTLDGDMDLSMKHGQFLKIDPGAAKLLGILSLQSLPRRINLDFRDIFSEGFAFDEIAGRLHLEQGSLYTSALNMNGPAAKIRMSGVVNLASETQNLRVNIQPRLEDTVAVAGALLGGPVVGLGTLVANKLLKNPIGQIVTFDYAVSGNWSDPVIRKVPRPVPEGEDGDGE